MIEKFIKIDKSEDGTIMFHQKCEGRYSHQEFKTPSDLLEFARDLLKITQENFTTYSEHLDESEDIEAWIKKGDEEAFQKHLQDEEDRLLVIRLLQETIDMILNFLSPEHDWNPKLTKDIGDILDNQEKGDG